ncbi:MAG: squalene synthase HpnC [Rhodopirellula sp.]|nr:squalene synthase HpnC [Rhodopirellula sp.]
MSVNRKIREEAARPVAEQVADWQPASDGSLANDEAFRETPSLEDANAYCRTLATGHYENFPLVSWLLPKGLHQHFYNVYSFCRWADDLGDEIGDTERSLELLGWWRHELSECYTGRCRHPVFVALRPTIDMFGIPEQPFVDLISAFEQDQSVLEYYKYDQVLDYCTRSANPVGRIVLYLCRQVCTQTFAWSDSICTGLQLANFWQDLSRDLDINRIYLPGEDRDRFGITREDLFARRTTDGFLELMKFEVDRARELLVAGLPLVEVLPGPLQIDIELFARGGLCILDRIERIGYRVLETRPVVTKFDALRMLTSCLCRAGRRRLLPGRRDT